ncbi:integron [Aureimonas populi]|uniref:Integron n=2 Tax=Aureimonas populi TaxID=1701758 RepID=A0ABW5CR48_9HYPH
MRWTVPVLLATGLAFEAVAAPAVPVRVGGDVDLPACAELGVIGETQSQEGRVDVRSGPTGTFQVLERLNVGDIVRVCDRNGTFVGVIYGEGDCGVAEPVARRASYRGSCPSGWVHNRSVEPAAPGAVAPGT